MLNTLATLWLTVNLHAEYGKPPPPPPPTPAQLKAEEHAKKLCEYVPTCLKSKPGKTAWCIKVGMKESGFLDHNLEGETAKDLARYLRKEGFEEKEFTIKDFKQLPDGAILVLDAHDPIADKRPACPKVYGNALVKCGERWIDDHSNPLDFHMKRGCRTKGIWVHPDLRISEPPQPKTKRFYNDTSSSPVHQPKSDD